jgi:hypothetical protein
MTRSTAFAIVACECLLASINKGKPFLASTSGSANTRTRQARLLGFHLRCRSNLQSY